MKFDPQDRFWAEKVIRHAWGKPDQGKKRESFGVDFRKSIKNTKISKNTPQKVVNLIKILDEISGYFMTMSFICILMANSTKFQDREKVILPLIAYITSQMISIRNLIILGFDVQARQLSRVLIEQLDIALLVSNDEDLRSEFRETVDERSSNLFWHSHSSKGKLKQKIYNKILNKTPGIDIKEFRNL